MRSIIREVDKQSNVLVHELPDGNVRVSVITVSSEGGYSCQSLSLKPNTLEVLTDVLNSYGGRS